MKINKEQTSDSFILSALLSLSGGFQDAYTYVMRGKVFANAQTGNIVLFSSNLMTGEMFVALHYLFPVLAFAAGTFIAEQIAHRFKENNRIHWRQIILIIEIILLAAVGFLPETMNALANIMVSLSCAMQVQSFRKVHGYGYASTMCIGNLRSGMESFSQFFHERKKEYLFKAMHYFLLIIIFAVGAGLGGVLSGVLGVRAIWISSAVLIICCSIMSRREFMHNI